MDTLAKIAFEVLIQMAADKLSSVYKKLVSVFWKRTKNVKGSEIQKLLEQIGAVEETAIRQLVERSAQGHNVPKDDREELIQLLTNLSKNARFHTTNGTKLSTVIRCEELIEKLLSNIHPKRSKGEAVAPNHSWILEEFLGMGGFGEVWRARKKYYSGSRAFKFFTDPAHQEWLKKEGTALSRVQEELGKHPNIVEYIDIETQATPYPYLSFEYVNGGSLEDWILQLPGEQQPLEIEKLMEGIIDGLCEAHTACIFHRDIKPANILLDCDDVEMPVPLIADFGLSRADQSTMKGAGASSAGSRQIIVGTQMYLPPEATSWGSIHPAQQDVFALGVTWYQLLTSKLERPPYDFHEQLRKHGVDSRTIRLISLCLAHPSRRFKDATKLKEAVHDLLPSPIWNIPDGCFDVGPLAVASFEGDLT